MLPFGLMNDTIHVPAARLSGVRSAANVSELSGFPDAVTGRGGKRVPPEEIWTRTSAGGRGASVRPTATMGVPDLSELALPMTARVAGSYPVPKMTFERPGRSPPPAGAAAWEAPASCGAPPPQAASA